MDDGRLIDLTNFAAEVAAKLRPALEPILQFPEGAERWTNWLAVWCQAFELDPESGWKA